MNVPDMVQFVGYPSNIIKFVRCVLRLQKRQHMTLEKKATATAAAAADAECQKIGCRSTEKNGGWREVQQGGKKQRRGEEKSNPPTETR